MRDLTPQRPGALCYDPHLPGPVRLRMRRADEVDGEEITVDGSIIACPRWVQPTFDAMAECAESGVDLAYLRGNRVAALVRTQNRQTGVGLRRRQFARHRDPEASLNLARSLIEIKTANQLALLRRAARRRNDSRLGEHADAVARYRPAIARALDLEALRGHEGIIARRYFAAWPRWLALPGFQRIPRRAANPINLLLDICYSRLCLHVTLALLDAGLDLGVGTLHRDDDRRPTLALDLMEPLRPLISDRFVLDAYEDAMRAPWFVEGQGRWVVTTEGRRRFNGRWTSWLHGSQRRSGHLKDIQSVMSCYGGWISGASDLNWPRIDG